MNKTEILEIILMLPVGLVIGAYLTACRITNKVPMYLGAGHIANNLAVVFWRRSD